MKFRFRVFSATLTILVLSACTGISLQKPTPTPLPQGPGIRGVFEGNTPCNPDAKLLFQIPAEAECDQMIWSVILNQDPQTESPTTYVLKTAYGISKQGTNDLIGGGTSISMQGNWTITTGTKSDPEATVYQINPDNSGTSVSFQKISDNLIHVLSKDNMMLVGNGAWSYTLDRMDNQSPTVVELANPPEPPTRLPAPPMPDSSSVFGVFDGGIPCHELVIEFTRNPAPPDCLKVKWRLTLYQDAATGAPSSYLFMGTSTYRQGSWTILYGMDGDPEATIYQLLIPELQQPISFLRVDENHLFLMDRSMNLLVGNELFSYTLSKVRTFMSATDIVTKNL